MSQSDDLKASDLRLSIFERLASLSISLLPLFPLHAGVRFAALLVNGDRVVKAALTLYAFIRVVFTPDGRRAVGSFFRTSKLPVVLLLTLSGCRLGSSFVSQDIRTSLASAFSDVHTWILFVVLGALLGNSLPQAARLISLLTRSAMVIAAIAGSEWLLGEGIIAPLIPTSDLYSELVQEDKVRDSLYRSQATFQHPLTMAHYFLMFLPFCVFQIWNAAGMASRTVSFVVTVVIYWGIYASGSRAALFMAAAEGATIATLLAGNMFYRPTAHKVMLIAVLLFTLMISFGAIGFWAIELIEGRSRSEEQSTSARMRQLEDGLPVVKQHWPLGVGTKMAAEFAGIKVRSGMRVIDNFYLSFTIESGIVALTAFAGLVMWSISTCLKRAIRTPSYIHRSYYLCWAVSISGFSIFCAFLSIHEQVHQYFYLFVGMLCGIGDEDRQPTSKY